MVTMNERSGSESTLRLLVLPLWIVAIYFLGVVMNEAATIFLWIVCAFFLFALLDPIAEYLKAKRWRTTWAAILLVVSATIISMALIYVFGILFSGMIAELEQSKRLFMQTWTTLNATWSAWGAKLSSFLSGAATNGGGDVSKVEVVHGNPINGEMGGTILHGLGSAFTVLTFSLLVPILTLFILVERDSLARTLGHAYRKEGEGAKTWKAMVKSVRAFFVGNLILAMITFPVFILLFWLFKLPSTFPTAALATFFNLIPFAGSVLSGFLPAVTLYAQNQSIGAALGLYGCCVAIHFIVADFITPKLLGSQLNINATTSTIALVAWGELWGGLGLILAIPLTSLIKIAFEHSSFFWLEWLATLMSDKADLAKKG